METARVPTLMKLAECLEAPGLVDVLAHESRRDHEQRRLNPRGFGVGYTLVPPTLARYVNASFDQAVLERGVREAPPNLRDDYRRLLFDASPLLAKLEPLTARNSLNIDLLRPDGSTWCAVDVDLVLGRTSLDEDWCYIGTRRARLSPRRRVAVEAILLDAADAVSSLGQRRCWLVEPRHHTVTEIERTDEHIAVKQELLALSARFQAAWLD